jgi:hypothetical protein
MPYKEPDHTDCPTVCEDCGKKFDACMSGYDDTDKCGSCWDKLNKADYELCPSCQASKPVGEPCPGWPGEPCT